MKHLRTYFQGIIMGIAELIPGVSGSTLALIMGIYDDFIGLLHGVSQVMKSVLKVVLFKEKPRYVLEIFQKEINLRFAIFLGLGTVTSFALLSGVMTHLLDTYPGYTFAFFFGMIIASLQIPYQQMDRKSVKELVMFVLVAIVVFLLLGNKPAQDNENPAYLLVFVVGIIAASAMALPGISGSYMMLLFGIYEYILHAVSDLARLQTSVPVFSRLVIFGLGVLVGFVTITKLIKWAFSGYKSLTLAALLGLMAGSLRTLYPFQYTYESTLIIVIALIMGAAVVLLVGKLAPEELKKID